MASRCSGRATAPSAGASRIQLSVIAGRDSMCATYALTACRICCRQSASGSTAARMAGDQVLVVAGGAARSGTLPCWRTARRTCAWRCGRGARCRRRWCRDSRARRSRRPGRRAAGRPRLASTGGSHADSHLPNAPLHRRGTKRYRTGHDHGTPQYHAIERGCPMTETTITKQPSDSPAVTPALPVRLPPTPPIPRFLQGLGFSFSPEVDDRPDRAPLRRRLHHANARVRPHRDRRRPGAGQAGVHGQHRRRRQHPAQPVAACSVRVRCSRSTAPSTAAAASC